MSFVTGMMLIDAPASALNNSGEAIPNARTDNTSSVKFIRAADGKTYPYVSAQAVRYWLRTALESSSDIEWNSSPVYREEKVAYTDANPLKYWDDDLLGYMRAPKTEHQAKRLADPDYKNMTQMEMLPGKKKGEEREAVVTRAAPLRMSTLVSIAHVNITADFGVMARQDGDPAPFEHQFYRATLHGLFSLDLNMAGKFFYRRRTGFQNLDKIRRDQAEADGLEPVTHEFAYRLNQQERMKRITSLLVGMGRLQGGAKQTIHYTDVAPAVVILAVTTGGNHPFNYLFREVRGMPQFQHDVFSNALTDVRDQLVSPVFIGWKHGFLPEEREKVEKLNINGFELAFGTPRVAFEQAAAWLKANPNKWDK